MAQNPLAVIASVEDVVVLPESSHIVITLGVGGPKVDLALEPDLALKLGRRLCQGLCGISRYQESAEGSALSFSLPGSKWARMKSGAS